MCASESHSGRGVDRRRLAARSLEPAPSGEKTGRRPFRDAGRPTKRAQKVTRVTSWNVRGGAAPVMAPNPVGLTRVPLAPCGRFVIVRSVRLAKLTVLLTAVNCVWLSALNASSLSSNITPR